MRISARRTDPSTAATGTPLRLTRLHSCQPGVARSRENAKNVREQLVTQAMPQKNWPMVEIRITVSAQPSFIEVVKMDSEVPPAVVDAGDVRTRRR